MLKLELILRAVADRTRLRLINLLQEGELCVCDLASLLAVPQPTISRHLAILRHCGLAVDRREGTRVVYTLAQAETPAVQALWRFLLEASSQEEVLQSDRERLRHVRRQGSLASRLPRGTTGKNGGSLERVLPQGN